MKQQQWTDDGVLEGSTHDLARVHPLLGQDMSAGRLYGEIVYRTHNALAAMHLVLCEYLLLKSDNHPHTMSKFTISHK